VIISKGTVWDCRCRGGEVAGPENGHDLRCSTGSFSPIYFLEPRWRQQQHAQWQQQPLRPQQHRDGQSGMHRGRGTVCSGRRGAVSRGVGPQRSGNEESEAEVREEEEGRAADRFGGKALKQCLGHPTSKTPSLVRQWKRPPPATSHQWQHRAASALFLAPVPDYVSSPCTTPALAPPPTAGSQRRATRAWNDSNNRLATHA
jgi:hypothetical protein